MTDRQLVLIGGGGHALSTLAALPNDVNVAGYVDLRQSGVLSPYLARLGDDSTFLSDEENRKFDILVTYVSDSKCSLELRRRIIERYSDFSSRMFVAPTAVVADGAEIGSGTVLFHRTVVNAGVRIGCHCIINTGAIIEHGCRMGNNVFVWPGVIICGDVSIGDNVYVGAGAVVKPGTRICNDTIIGLGTLVISNIEEPAIYAGCPAKKIRE